MSKIIHISIFFRIFFQILFLALPLFLILAWLHSTGSLKIIGGLINLNYIPAAYSNHILHSLSSSEKYLALGLNIIPLMGQLYILFALINLFKRYEKGEIFSIQNVHYIRNLGYALFILQIIDLLYQGAMGFILTSANPEGHRFAAITLEQSQLGRMFIALIIILISWIMAEASKLSEEQQLTI